MLAQDFTEQGRLRWGVQLALFLIPVIIYGAMCAGTTFLKSEASEKGLGLGDAQRRWHSGARRLLRYLVIFFKNDLWPSG